MKYLKWFFNIYKLMIVSLFLNIFSSNIFLAEMVRKKGKSGNTGIQSAEKALKGFSPSKPFLSYRFFNIIKAFLFLQMNQRGFRYRKGFLLSFAGEVLPLIPRYPRLLFWLPLPLKMVMRASGFQARHL